MQPSAFKDRRVTLKTMPEQLSDLAFVLGSGTRLAILNALMASPTPLHINALARVIGIDASPVRTHLELLVKAGLIEEVSGLTGRERKFTTRVQDVKVVLEGATAAPQPTADAPAPKEVAKLEKKRAALEKDLERLHERARRVQAEILAAWGKKPTRSSQG